MLPSENDSHHGSSHATRHRTSRTRTRSQPLTAMLHLFFLTHAQITPETENPDEELFAFP